MHTFEDIADLIYWKDDSLVIDPGLRDLETAYEFDSEMLIKIIASNTHDEYPDLPENWDRFVDWPTVFEVYKDQKRHTPDDLTAYCEDAF